MRAAELAVRFNEAQAMRQATEIARGEAQPTTGFPLYWDRR